MGASAAKRDPGIPNMWPYKEQLLKQMEERKQRMEDEKARQKEARKRLVEKKRQRHVRLLCYTGPYQC
jgi:nuclear GTP-binding protein